EEDGGQIEIRPPVAMIGSARGLACGQQGLHVSPRVSISRESGAFQRRALRASACVGAPLAPILMLRLPHEEVMKGIRVTVLRYELSHPDDLEEAIRESPIAYV